MHADRLPRGRSVAVLLTAFALAACQEGPSAEFAPPPGSAQQELTCEGPEEERPETFFQIAGILEEADYWDCRRPSMNDGEFVIDDSTGTQATVTGSSAEFALDWYGPEEIAGRNLLFWVGAAGGTRVQNGLIVRSDGGRGYYRWVIPDEANPLSLDFLIQPEAVGGDVNINFAIDDTLGDPTDPRIGGIRSHTLFVIEVGSGDIQINLNWNTLVDLDLWVTDPAGFKIYYGDDASPSGGSLDLDSYPNCNFEGDRGRGNENVFWAVGAAPAGEYQVQVNMYDDCGTYAAGTPTLYRLTVVQHGEAEVYNGTFSGGPPASTHNAAAFTY